MNISNLFRGIGRIIIPAPRRVINNYHYHSTRPLVVNQKAKTPSLEKPKKGSQKLTDQQVRDIVRDRATGQFTYHELGRRYGVSDSYVWHIVHGNARQSVTGINNTKLAPRKTRYLTPDEVLQIENDLRYDSISRREIARRHNVCRTTVANIAHGRHSHQRP